MSLPTSVPLSLAELTKRAERQFSIWGPNSGGGHTVLLVDGMLYDVVYGDESRLPGGAEQVSGPSTPAEYAARVASHPMYANLLAYLRERELIV